MVDAKHFGGEVPEESMPLLAHKTATELVSRLGVDGAFVVVIRKSDDSMGAAMLAPTTACDSMVAICVNGLAMCRSDLLEQIKKLQESPPTNAPPSNPPPVNPA